MHAMADVAVLSSSATRHSCKVCRKGFPCGRSLGGHMRSHSLAEVETALDDDDDDGDDGGSGEEHRHRQHGGSDCATAAPGAGGYGLRENPKKTRRLSSLNDGGSVDERSSSHGGGGRGELLSPCASSVDVDHERRRARGGGVELELDDAVLTIPTEPASGLMMPPPRRRRRSMRVPAPAPPPSPPAFDEEPEDVALCLIMLSRDIVDHRRATGGGREYSPEEDSTGRRDYPYQYHHHHDAADSNDGTKVINKRKLNHRSLVVGDEQRRGRYECPGCGRAFQSYQALGGHRASHKRINSNCSIARAAVADHQPEPSVDTNTSSFGTASPPDANYAADMAMAATTAVVALKAKPHKPIRFECPICFRVFGSGQALGGHKRSHSIAGELYERAHVVEDDGIIGDDEHPLVSDRFLDLNLPAPGVED